MQAKHPDRNRHWNVFKFFNASNVHVQFDFQVTLYRDIRRCLHIYFNEILFNLELYYVVFTAKSEKERYSPSYDNKQSFVYIPC